MLKHHFLYKTLLTTFQAIALSVALTSAIIATGGLALALSSPDSVSRTLSRLSTTYRAKFPDLKNWGLSSPESKAHISAIEAWKIQRGNPAITVAIIDTGIDANHPSLSPNLWHDPNFKKGDSAEYGWDYVKNTANPKDEHGHGTHVAGIVGAVSDFKKGVSGVAPGVSLMGVRYYSDTNTGAANLKNTIRSIHYAIDHGARIINYSGGGPEFSEEEYLAIKRAESAGILFVSAAGNEKQDTDLVENYYYPSAYRLSNIISVAAIDRQNALLKSSNWGKKRVDVVAPGEGIYSTLPGGKYGIMSGTSQATAFVTGIAALLLSQNQSLSPTQLRELIRNSVDPISALNSRIASGGKVNAYRALLALSQEKLVRSPVSLSPDSFMKVLTFPSRD